MTVFHCPRCGGTFRVDAEETVFCPDCRTVLCESFEVADTPDGGRKERRKRISEILGTFGCCGIMAYVFLALYMPFAFQPHPDPLAFIIMGPVWCVVSYPILRVFTKEYSVRTGLLSLFCWFFSFAVLWAIAFSVSKETRSLREWTVIGTLLGLLPGAIIAFFLGRSEHFLRLLFGIRKK